MPTSVSTARVTTILHAIAQCAALLRVPGQLKIKLSQAAEQAEHAFMKC